MTLPLVVLGGLGLAALYWPPLRWVALPLNAGLALVLLVPFAIVIPEWLGPGGESMTIRRWGEVQKTAPPFAILLRAIFWLLLVSAGVGFGLMGNKTRVKAR